MTTDEVRKKYLDFFKSAPRNHQEVKPAPLVLKDDLTTLFNSSGMQQLVSYLKGKTHPQGKRLVNSQPCLRAKDILEVGDNRHTTFFEMLGNWSLGDYFKKEQLPWLWEFLTRQLGLPQEKLYIGVFAGDGSVPKDEESKKIWLDLGVPQSQIFEYGVDKNWWSIGGTPAEMAEGEIGGPDSEVFFEFTQIEHNPKFGKTCHPNCDCGRFLEIGNSVFMEYQKRGGKLIELPQKNVDFGGGLERLTAAVNNNPDVFQIDVFKPMVERIEKVSKKEYRHNSREMRIIADHLRASCFLIADGVIPYKEGQGSILRRLIRRSIDAVRILGVEHSIISYFAEPIPEFYSTSYPGLLKNYDKIMQELSQEENKYTNEVLTDKVLQKAKESQQKLNLSANYSDPVRGSAVQAFNSLATYSVPVELSLGYAQNAGTVSPNQVQHWWDEFYKEKNRHQEISRASSKQKFSK